MRNLQFWIESNVLLVLKDAPFDKRDAQLIPTAGSCADCPKRTGHNKLLFGDDLGRQGDRCTDPLCYQSKLTAHVSESRRVTRFNQHSMRSPKLKAPHFINARLPALIRASALAEGLSEPTRWAGLRAAGRNLKAEVVPAKAFPSPPMVRALNECRFEISGRSSVIPCRVDVYQLPAFPGSLMTT